MSKNIIVTDMIAGEPVHYIESEEMRREFAHEEAMQENLSNLRKKKITSNQYWKIKERLISNWLKDTFKVKETEKLGASAASGFFAEEIMKQQLRNKPKK
jgi:alpha-galactosidase/6-phospho-beta-glucosidase family protein